MGGDIDNAAMKNNVIQDWLDKHGDPKIEKQVKMALKKITRTREEELAATRPNVYRNRKKYTRKSKHEGRSNDILE